jgi:AraC-like DNA-binding protein
LGHATRGTKEEHTLPAVHALHLADLVKRWNVTAEELFEGSDVRLERLSDPEERISIPTSIRLVERARALTGEPAIGVYLGMQMRISAHGYLGFAAMTSATVREAIELAMRFAPTRTTALGLRLSIEGGAAALVIDEHADFGPARDAWITALVVGLWQIGNAITGRELSGSADFRFPEPAYHARFAPVAPRVRFAQPANQLVFDASILDLPLTMADPAAQRLAREQCERELLALGAARDVVARTRSLIAKKDGGYRSIEEVAVAMHVSARTLKRQLAASGVAYSTLLAEQQRDRALLLLRASDASMEEIAEQVGYSDVANFARAFRRWTGTTPGAYRRKRA